MTYDAISAYTVLFGDGDGPPRVSVHGSAEEAWHALDLLVRPHGDGRPHDDGRLHEGRRRGGWWPGGAPGLADAIPEVDPVAVHDAAERWRRADPTRRCWQVAPHRLQVTVPAIART